MVPEPTTPVPRARARRRRLAWAAMVVVAWGISLGPIVHALLHERPHRHLADGAIVFDETLPHVHADGTSHGDIPELPSDPSPAPEEAPVPTPAHGASSLAHFGAALQSGPPPCIPLRPIPAAALPVAPRASVHHALLAPTPIQPRAPPIA